jgi:hypothetical protein
MLDEVRVVLRQRAHQRRVQGGGALPAQCQILPFD